MAPHALVAQETTNPTPKPTGKTLPTSSTPNHDTLPHLAPPPTTSALLHHSPTHPPSTVISAHQSTLTLSTGRTILDACGGAAVTCLGYSHPTILHAATSQLTSVAYIHTGAYTTPSAETLATSLLSLPNHPFTSAFFVSSGSEAMDSALKLSRQYFFFTGQAQRVNYVSRRQSYHGNTLGAMSVSSNLPRKIPYATLQLPNVSFVSPAYYYQHSLPHETEADYATCLAHELETEFLRLGPETVVAFIAETVVGATTGCVPPPKGYFEQVRRICDKYGILLILDEVMCGAGRTGTYFAFEQEGIVPDICTVGKGLGGGYAAIAGVMANRKVVEGVNKAGGLVNGFTYQCHPVACAVAGAVLGVLLRERLVERCRELGAVLEGLLRRTLAGRKFVGDIRGGGLFWGVEFVRDRERREPFEPERDVGGRVQRKAFELGLAVYPGRATVDGVRGDHVLLAPAYTVERAELERAVAVLGVACEVVEGELGGEGW